MHIWQSKRVLKSGPHWQVPNHIKNRPKGVSKADWDAEVKDWKFNKLLVLDKAPKVSKKNNQERKKNNDNDN
jgi:hypothetical protein